MPDFIPPDPPAVPRRPRFIAGVYNHCDRWCERCRFQDRCRLFRQVARHEAHAAGLSFPTEEEDEAAQQPDPQPPLSEHRRRTLLAWMDEVTAAPTDEDIAASRRAWERLDALADRHELSVAGEEYAAIAQGLVEALRAMSVTANDPVLLTALETVERLARLLRPRLRRAALHVVALDLPPDLRPHCALDDPTDAQSSGNGSAKVARLALAELRMTWEVLSVAAIAADGVAAAMVRRSEALDELVAAHYPRAMAFVRPGFDEEG